MMQADGRQEADTNYESGKERSENNTNRTKPFGRVIENGQARNG